MKKEIIIICFLCICCGLQTYAQQPAPKSITVRDGSSIQFNAKNLLDEYITLLKQISSSDNDARNIEDFIVGSHSGVNNKIFLNKEILVEDDLNDKASSTKFSLKSIDTYLRDFDLYYAKSDSVSIAYNGFQISNIKQGDEGIYIKIDFKLLLSNKHKMTGKAFAETWRTVQISAIKSDTKWITQIVRIGYFVQPKDSLVAHQNDIELIADNDTKQINDTAKVTLTQKELRLLQQEEVFKLQTAFNQEQASKEKEFRTILDNADKALGQEDLKIAKDLYVSAKRLMPNLEVRHIKRQLRRIEELEEEIRTRPERLCREFVQKAKNFQRLRKYTDAKTYFEKALEQKPDVDSLKRIIEKLNLSIRTLASIEAKITQNQHKEAEEEADVEISKLKEQEKKRNFNKALYSDLLTWQAVALVGKNNWEKAEKKFKEAIDKDANNSNAYRQRALANYQNTKYTEALSDIQVYLSFDENNATAWADLARCHFGIGDSTKGMYHLSKAIKLDPQNQALAYEQASIWEYWNKPREAIDAYTKILAHNFRSAHVLFHRGLNYHSLKQYSKAANDFEQATKLDNSSFKSTIAEITEQLYVEGKTRYYDTKNYPEAIQQFANAILYDKTLKNAWYWKGMAHNQIEQYSEAKKAFSKALQIESIWADAYFNRGVAKFLDEEYEESILDFKTAFQQSNELYKALIYKGDAHVQLQQYSLAAEAFSDALLGTWVQKSENYPALSIVYGKKAEAYFNKINAEAIDKKNFSVVVKDLKECLRYNKNYAGGYFLRGQTYTAMGDYGNAIDDFEKALEIEYDKGTCYFAMAEAYRLKKKYDDAIKTYTKALQREEWQDNRAEAHRQRAWCFMEEKKYLNALTDYEKHQELLAGKLSSEIRIEMAIAYLKTNQNEEAKEMLDTIIAQKVRNAEVLFSLGCYYFLEGNSEEAQRYFKQSFDMGLIMKEIKTGLLKPFLENNKLKSLIENIIK